MERLTLIFLLFAIVGQVSVEGLTCPKGKLPCDDSLQCIDRDGWCDQAKHCDDYSDEEYCHTKSFFTTEDPNDCAKTHFLCDNGRCYPLAAQCDGYENCNDGSDEKNCNAVSSILSTWKPLKRKPFSRTTAIPTPTRLKRWTNKIKAGKENDVVSSEEVDDYEDEENDDYEENGEKEESKEEKDENDLIELFPNRKNGKKAIEKGVRWIMSIRKDNYGWDSSTARALIAIGLSEPNMFLNASKDVALMKKQLQIFIAMDMIRDHTQHVTLNRLALYINAMLATCQDPRNLYGLNLVRELRSRTSAAQKAGYRSRVFINPIVYLTLCLMEQTTQDDIYKLRETLRLRAEEPRWHDMQALSIMVFACIERFPRHGNSYVSELEKEVKSMVSRMKEGRIGNIYSTALAAQALLAAGKHNRWNPQKTIQFLKNSQQENGSFGDILATYYVLPILAGKSFLDLKSTPCQVKLDNSSLMSIDRLQNWQGEKHYVRYSLHFGEPLTLSYSIQLRVPVNTSFFDIMRLAEYDDPKFKFQYEEKEDFINVFSIGNVPNDAERGHYWQLYGNANSRTPQVEILRPHNLQPIRLSVKKFYPKSGDHVTFWHRPIGN